VLLNGLSLPQSRTNGWQFEREQAFLIIHLSGPGPHRLEIIR
jgi:hypothetical protein